MIGVPAIPPIFESLAIFPLPATQLFPHTLLPLHVFEPRYRALTRDVLAGSRLLAVPMLAPGYEPQYGNRPAVLPICGLGQIIQSHLHADGRYDILLRGLARVRILDELPPSLTYRRVRAERIEDDATAADLWTEHRCLLTLCDRLASVLPAGSETLRELARQESAPGAACDVVAAALLTEPGDRQRVLETLDPHQRLEHVTEALAALLAGVAATRPPGMPQPN